MSQNQYLFDRAKQVIPGGVNSPVRAFKSVDGTPPFIKRGQGPYLFDEEGKRYLDYVCSWGALILGHAHPEVTKAMQQAMENGSSFGAPTLLEIKLAEKICQLVPSVEMIRMVNSGTEATMSAIRLARAFTRKNKIIKFAGCYHGHADALLVQAGSGVLTLGIPSTPGIPSKVTEDTLVANFNNLNDTEQLFQTYGQDIAAVIIEPVACNMNCILPQPGFLSDLRTLCNDYHSLLIFDEVITGFRLGLAGAQGYFSIEPDLTTFGKIIGGGMPVGAYGGKKVIMEQMAPLGSVYQAGTLSGNPVAMSAGLATLELISKPGFYTQLASQTGKLVNGISELAQQAKIPLHINQIGSIFGLFFTEQTEINCFAQVKQCHLENFQRFFHAMLNEGIYLAPSAFEAGFITAAHGDEEINQTLLATEKALHKIKT